MTLKFRVMIFSILLAGLFQISHNSYAEGQVSMITKTQLQEMFKSMGEGTDWDLSGELLWGFFFTDSEKAVLEKAAPNLEKMGFRVVNIYLSDKDSPEEPDLWWLHVERREHHDADSLFERNNNFYKFASDYKIGSYDGMDVGP